MPGSMCIILDGIGGPDFTYTLTAENYFPRIFHKLFVGTKSLSIGKIVDCFFIN
jgi:hypothetical protein